MEQRKDRASIRDIFILLMLAGVAFSIGLLSNKGDKKSIFSGFFNTNEVFADAVTGPGAGGEEAPGGTFGESSECGCESGESAESCESEGGCAAVDCDC